jgi:hypothetical protein
MLGTYYTLQALMGAILELVIKILIALVIIIVGLWILPFTWPVAASMSAVFLAIAIPMAIIIYFMTEVLHIRTSGLPNLRCFDRKTKFMLLDNSYKYIEELNPNDILLDGSIVTAKIKVSAKDLDMFNLNGIIVSESHIVKYKNKWIPVREHPSACKIHIYNEPYLYCLNTSTKTIILNKTIFTDWDEIYDESLEYLLNYKTPKKTEDISLFFDCGFEKNTKIRLINEEKTISKINIGDILSTGGIVYGIVELANNNLGNEKLYNLLVTNKKIEVGNIIHFDYNHNIDTILELNKNII